jgi:hypothetical protein
MLQALPNILVLHTCCDAVKRYWDGWMMMMMMIAASSKLCL